MQQIQRHVFGITGHELDPFKSVDVVKTREQIGQPRFLFVFVDVQVAVDGLPQQRDFFGSLIGKDDSFVVNFLRMSSLFGSARHGHDAVSAKFVTSDLDSQKRLKRIRTHRWIAHRIKRFVATFDIL